VRSMRYSIAQQPPPPLLPKVTCVPIFVRSSRISGLTRGTGKSRSVRLIVRLTYVPPKRRDFSELHDHTLHTVSICIARSYKTSLPSSQEFVLTLPSCG
jgi:hypothetical protein